jgi:hypothetical protein
MQLNHKNLSLKIKSAFKLKSEEARYEALLEILNQIKKKGMNIKDVISELISGLSKEQSSLVLSGIWYELSRFGPEEELKAFAEKELDNPNPDHRQYALMYIAQTYKEEKERLFEKMRKDTDPWVLYETGYAILDVNPKAAVNLWLETQRFAPVELATEVLPQCIGKYADEDIINQLRKIASLDPNDHLTLWNLREAETWHSVDYIEAKLPVKIGKGYIINCPNCNEYLGIREGHVGERARCRLCQHEFIIPDRPKE